MPAQRAKKLFDEFLATAVAEHKFSSASLSIQDSSSQVLRRYERLVGMTSRGGYFPLDHEQCAKCIDELIKDEAFAPGAASSFLLTHSIVIAKWRIDGEEVPTSSRVVMNYGRLPCISTFFQFETVEQFQSVKRVLKNIGLCKLNEAHLKPIKIRKAAK